MKKIKYLIFGLLLGCLGLTSFSSAFETVSVNLYGDTNNRVGKPSEISSLPFAICGEKGITIYFCMGSAGSCSEYTFNPPSGVSSWAGLSSCIYVNNNNALNYWKYFYASQDTTVNFYQLSPCSSSSCDYSQYESTISTLSGSLASCQSDLANCENTPTCEDCSSIQESLSGCLEDYDSVSNMNQSLSDELEACLSSGGDGCNPEIDTGCVEGAIMPLLSWSVGLDSFSTPIINNLTLPTNYKGKLVDGVLSISSINQNLSIDDSDYGNIKDSFVSIVLYIFGVGLMLILVYYIKFYFFNIKD